MEILGSIWTALIAPNDKVFVVSQVYIAVFMLCVAFVLTMKFHRDYKRKCNPNFDRQPLDTAIQIAERMTAATETLAAALDKVQKADSKRDEQMAANAERMTAATETLATALDKIQKADSKRDEQMAANAKKMTAVIRKLAAVLVKIQERDSTRDECKANTFTRMGKLGKFIEKPRRNLAGYSISYGNMESGERVAALDAKNIHPKLKSGKKK